MSDTLLKELQALKKGQLEEYLKKSAEEKEYLSTCRRGFFAMGKGIRSITTT
jgi:hypothetical protein